MRQHLLGFAICLVVGLGLACIVMLVGAVLALPHELVADSTVDVRRMIIVALAFAIVCSVVRYFVRGRSIPRAPGS